MFRLSVLLPAVGDDASFEHTLVSVLENRPTSCEVIVVAPTDYTDPYDLHEEVKLLRVSCRRPAWMTLANVGLAASRGAYVNLLLPGLEVLERWDTAAIDRLQRRARTGAVASLAIDDRVPDAARGIAGLTCSGADLRSYRYIAMPADESAGTMRVDGVPSWCGFFRRQDLLDVGGWDERLSEAAADIDLALRLRRRGLACICEKSSCVVYRQNVFDSQHWSARQRGRELEQLFWRHVPRLRWSTVLAYPWSWLRSLATPSVLMGRVSAWRQSCSAWTVAEFAAATQHHSQPLAARSRAA